MEENWLAGQAGDGYVALWCSDLLKPYNDQLFDCEYRAESRNSAYVCICGSKKEYGSLGEFLESCKGMKPVYQKEYGRLEAGNESLVYERYENLTQYI